MTHLFEPSICFKNDCDKLSMGACFGDPYKCKINKKAGYPKEINTDFQKDTNEVIKSV